MKTPWPHRGGRRHEAKEPLKIRAFRRNALNGVEATVASRVRSNGLLIKRSHFEHV